MRTHLSSLRRATTDGNYREFTVFLFRKTSGECVIFGRPFKKIPENNDTTLPLDFILKSVGKGNNIKIKIIDKPSHAKPEAIANVGNIVELIDTEKQDLKGTGLPPKQCDNVTNVTSEAGFKGEMFNLFSNNYFKGV